MKNGEFKIGSHILIHGYKGIVEEITKCTEYRVSFNGSKVGKGTSCLTEQSAEEMRKKGYELSPTGRTATYFNVSFDCEEDLKNTTYNHGEYGCIDEFENYGTW